LNRFNGKKDIKETDMRKISEIYKCRVCGNIVEVVHAGAGELVCCGQQMTLMVENTTDAAREKHIPVIQKIAEGTNIKVGSIAHPMEEKHFIEWIELITDGKTARRNLKPGDSPEAVFAGYTAPFTTVRAYCNLHGLWKA
jgi:superoxide reductase